MKHTKKKLSNFILSKLGADYARLMGYEFISDGVWRSPKRKKYTALHIGKVMATINFIADGNSLNIKEIRRVNRGFPQQ